MHMPIDLLLRNYSTSAYVENDLVYENAYCGILCSSKAVETPISLHLVQ